MRALRRTRARNREWPRGNGAQGWRGAGALTRLRRLRPPRRLRFHPFGWVLGNLRFQKCFVSVCVVELRLTVLKNHSPPVRLNLHMSIVQTLKSTAVIK